MNSAIEKSNPARRGLFMELLSRFFGPSFLVLIIPMFVAVSVLKKKKN